MDRWLFDAFIAQCCAQLERCLSGRLAEDCILVSDSHGAYRLFAKRCQLPHRTVNLRAGVRVDGERIRSSQDFLEAIFRCRTAPHTER